MTGLLALLLLLEPAAGAGPAGIADPGDPLARRVASLLAGAPVVRGTLAVVPLHAPTPEEAGHGRSAGIGWAGSGLGARFLVEDGRGYLRVVNPRREPVFLAAGTLFAFGAAEVAVTRDTIVPGDFAALVPADALGAAGDLDLAFAGVLPPRSTGSLLAGERGETPCLPVLASGAVRARRDRLASDLAPILRGPGGTAVGVVFLAGDRPVAAHVFARHDLFVAALPDLLLGLAAESLEDESRRQAAARRRPPGAEARRRALAWLRGIARAGAGHGEYGETCGAGLEVLVTEPTLGAIGHAVFDPQGTLLHAGFYAIPSQELPPTPPENPDEPPPGLRRTLEEQRRADRLPEPAPPAGAPADPQAAVADPVLVPAR